MTFAVWLVLYLCAQALHYLFAYGTYWIVGPGWLYGWVWGISTGLLAICCLGMAWEALWGIKGRAKPLAFAFLLSGAPCRYTFVNLGHSAGWADWLILAEACILLWSGTVLIAMAAHRYTNMYSVLGAYWLIRGGWNLCYELNPGWMPANPYVPLALNLTAMGTILLLLRPVRRRDSSPGCRPEQSAR
jgi:hypothetical protein